MVVDHEFLEYPRSVTIDPSQTFIYFTDWGSRPAVYRSDYYGNQVEVISDHLADMPIKNPNGLFLLNRNDGHTHLYLLDSQYDSGESAVYTDPPALRYIFGASADAFAVDDFDVPRLLENKP